MTRYVPVEELTEDHIGREAVVTRWTDNRPQPPFYGVVQRGYDMFTGEPNISVQQDYAHAQMSLRAANGQLESTINHTTQYTTYVQEDPS